MACYPSSPLTAARAHDLTSVFSLLPAHELLWHSSGVGTWGALETWPGLQLLFGPLRHLVGALLPAERVTPAPHLPAFHLSRISVTALVFTRGNSEKLFTYYITLLI